jgi:hypothetical protein
VYEKVINICFEILKKGLELFEDIIPISSLETVLRISNLPAPMNTHNELGSLIFSYFPFCSEMELKDR